MSLELNPSLVKEKLAGIMEMAIFNIVKTVIIPVVLGLREQFSMVEKPTTDAPEQTNRPRLLQLPIIQFNLNQHLPEIIDYLVNCAEQSSPEEFLQILTEIWEILKHFPTELLNLRGTPTLLINPNPTNKLNLLTKLLPLTQTFLNALLSKLKATSSNQIKLETENTEQHFNEPPPKLEIKLEENPDGKVTLSIPNFTAQILQFITSLNVLLNEQQTNLDLAEIHPFLDRLLKILSEKTEDINFQFANTNSLESSDTPTNFDLQVTMSISNLLEIVNDLILQELKLNNADLFDQFSWQGISNIGKLNLVDLISGGNGVNKFTPNFWRILNQILMGKIREGKVSLYAIVCLKLVDEESLRNLLEKCLKYCILCRNSFG